MAERNKRLEPGEIVVCKCECGGRVIGTHSFGRLWTWCEKCTPVVTIDLRKLLPSGGK